MENGSVANWKDMGPFEKGNLKSKEEFARKGGGTLTSLMAKVVLTAGSRRRRG